MAMTVGDLKTALNAISDDSMPVYIEIPDGGPASFTVPGYTFKPGAHTKPLETFSARAVAS